MHQMVRLMPLVILTMFPVASLAGPQDDAAAGYLGILLQRVEGGLAEALDLEEDAGVLVSQVVDDSPAAKAGLKAGDIVTRIDKEDVGTPAELRRVIRGHREGDAVRIHYLRDGKKQDVEVTLGDAKVGDDALAPRDGRHRMVRELRFHENRGFLGVSTQPLSGGLGEYFGVKDNQGALVAEVVDDSPAAKLGLKAGDVIVKLADKDIEDPGTLSRAVRDYTDPESVEVVWIRDRKQKSGKVELEIRETGPMRWLQNNVLGNLDLGDVELRGDDHRFPGMHRRVKIERLGDDLDQELDTLRQELVELRKQVEELRKNK
jgi:S1-C subfamily serine protease